MEPIRCVTCNAVLHFERFDRQAQNDGGAKAALDEMGVRRFCCRRMYISHPRDLEELLRGYPLRTIRTPDYSITFEAAEARTVAAE